MIVGYQEGAYWERRYRGGGSSGAGLAYEHEFIVDNVRALTRGARVESIWDVGIGDGRLAAKLVDALPTSVRYGGVDLSPSGLTRAKTRLPLRVELQVGDVADTALAPARDAVLCFNVLYHVATTERANALVRNLLASASKAVLVLTWNQKILEREPKLATHCHFRPFGLPEGAPFVIAGEEAVPGSPHKTLYTLLRA